MESGSIAWELPAAQWLMLVTPLMLASLRCFGLLAAMPVFGGAAVTLRLRILLSLCLGVLVMPTLPTATTVPELPKLAWLAVGEIGLGLLLGFGMRMVLSGLQLAGQMIDEQAGLAFGQVLNPTLGDETTVSGNLLLTAGLMVFLTLSPAETGWLMIGPLLDTFAAVPVGAVETPAGLPGVLTLLAEQSFVLALRVAAPLLAMLTLMSLAVAFLGRLQPGAPYMATAIPARIAISLALLGATLSGLTDHVADLAPDVVQHIQSLTFRSL